MTAMATLRLLEMLRDLPPGTKFYHASSSEIFGNPSEVPQDEDTAFNPVNPYGCAKAFATQMVRIYRKSLGLFACNGITYNHESPRRGENFVSRKICRAAAAIQLGIEKELVLGDLTAERDWGDARDYVRGMWLTLQHGTPEDFVFATGVLHTVQDLVEQAFQAVGLEWKSYVRQDERFMRRAEPHRLVGNPAKAGKFLHWEPQTNFEALVREMTLAELRDLSK
jgi:GDPmannose 4,6-dehydratase